MSEIRKYPYGYSITVCNRQDILDCLDKNVVDKEVVLRVIDSVEEEIFNSVMSGESASLPYLGRIHVDKEKRLLRSEEVRDIMDESRKVLTKEEYFNFKKKLEKDVYSSAKMDRYYHYIVGTFIKKHPNLYKHLLENHTEEEARIIIYTCRAYTTEDQYKVYHGTD